MNRYKIAAATILSALLLTLSGCLSLLGGNKTQTTNPYVDIEPVILYQLSTQQISSADRISLYIITEKNTQLQNQNYRQVSHQRLSVDNPDTESMRSSMHEVLTMGSHDITLSEHYENGTGYVTINGSSFSAPLTIEQYSARFAPAVCFDLSLYEHKEVCAFGADTAIILDKASAPENWAVPAEAKFNYASGYAYLNESGILTRSQYTVSYTQGAANITESVKIIISPEARQDFTLPNICTPIESFDIPRILEQSCGYLLQTNNISSTATTTTNYQTFGIERTETTTLTKHNTDGELSATIDKTIHQVHQSRGGETVAFRQIEHFENGIYTISQNGTAPAQRNNVDALSMSAYCEEVLVQDILLPEHIGGANITQSDDTLIITFEPKQTFAEAICSKISSTLYNDPDILHNVSSALETQALQFALELDKETLLPVAICSEYSAYHIIEQIPYLLENKTEQTYQYE